MFYLGFVKSCFIFNREVDSGYAGSRIGVWIFSLLLTEIKLFIKRKDMKNIHSKLLITVFIMMTGMNLSGQNAAGDWRNEFNTELQLMGHRNWILIVDAAYPLQSRPGIKTLVTGEDQLDVLREVLKAVDQAPHVFAEVFLDKEIDYVPEKEARGIENYRKELKSLLSGREVMKTLHEKLIADVDEAARTFNILILKTNMTIPYTSVFLRLNCGYWSPEQEADMRKKMKK